MHNLGLVNSPHTHEFKNDNINEPYESGDKLWHDKKMKEYTDKGHSYDEASNLVAIWENAVWEYRKSEIASGRYREDRNYENFIGNTAVSTYLINNSIKKSR